MTASLTTAQVRAYAPQFASAVAFPDGLIQAVIDECPLYLEGFGATDVAQVSAWRLWVCHTLTVQTPEQSVAGGPVIHQAVGRVVVQNAPGAVGAGLYGRTSYGQRLQELINAIFGGPIVA